MCLPLFRPILRPIVSWTTRLKPKLLRCGLVQEWCDYFRSGATTDARKQDAWLAAEKTPTGGVHNGSGFSFEAVHRAASVSAARPKSGRANPSA